MAPGDGELTLDATVVGAEKERRHERTDRPVLSDVQRIEVDKVDE